MELCGGETATGRPCANEKHSCRWHGSILDRTKRSKEHFAHGVSSDGTKRPKEHFAHGVSPDPVQRSEDINFVWKHTRRGKSQAWIAGQLGCSQPTVSRLLKEGRLLHAPPGVEEERIVALARNQELYQLVMDEIEGGVDSSTLAKLVAVADSLEKSRRKLLGIDAPRRVDLTTHEVDPADVELAEIIREQQARRADEEGKIRGHRTMDPS